MASHRCTCGTILSAYAASVFYKPFERVELRWCGSCSSFHRDVYERDFDAEDEYSERRVAA